MSEPAEYGLVMPFVVCASKGGPYEDQAFCAGYHAGSIDRELQHCALNGLSPDAVTVETSLVPQIDLIAMRHGFRIETEPDEDVPEYTHVWFVLDMPRTSTP